MIERLRSRPEIASFGLCDLEVNWSMQNQLAIDGRAPAPKGQRGPVACIRAISPGYLETLGINLQRGRLFNDGDTADSQLVALVSSAFAEMYWPGENPIGKRIRQDSGNPADESRWLTVVGVTATTMQGNYDSTASPQVYVPFTQYDDIQRMTVFMRARGGDPAALSPVLRSTVRGLNEELPVYFAQTLEYTLFESRFTKKLVAGLFAVFGIVAFALSAVGLYGVMSYSVTQRRQEIGVRVALGATPRDVLRLILRQGGWQLGIGLVIGVALAIVGGQLLASILWGVTPGDAVSYGATVLSLGAVGFLATLIPALRALQIDPAEVLRAE
jgi:predicted permease